MNLAQALKDDNAREIEWCWQSVVMYSLDMQKLLVQLRDKSPFAQGDLIPLITSIIETNVKLNGWNSNSPYTLNERAHSVYNLIIRAGGFEPNKQEKNIIKEEAVLLRKVGVTRPMPRITSEIETTLSTTSRCPPRGDLFSLDITKGTRPYIESIAEQANGSFEQGWYDACAVMLRRLLETLIIECYERHEMADSIKGEDGNFFSLRELIAHILVLQRDFTLLRDFALPRSSTAFLKLLHRSLAM